MPTNNNPEFITEREQFFVPADLATDDKNCADDRAENVIHMFGGALFVPFNMLVLQETADPGSAGSLTDMTEWALKVHADLNIKNAGIHSDAKNEEGNELRLDQDGPLGCAYAQLRAEISQLIADNPEAVLERAATILPELFRQEGSREYGTQVIAAHDRLAKRADNIIAPGRDLARHAVKAGAPSVVLAGSHDKASVGIVNTMPNTKFDSAAAREAGLPAYDHELWASAAMFEALPNAPDARKVAIASIIDITGVFMALNVEEAAAR